MGDVKRSVRVSARVQAELAELLQRKIKDPRVAGVVISRVTMTDDLRLVRVKFRLLQGDDEARREEALEGLRRATPLLRRELTRNEIGRAHV